MYIQYVLIAVIFYLSQVEMRIHMAITTMYDKLEKRAELGKYLRATDDK